MTQSRPGSPRRRGPPGSTSESPVKLPALFRRSPARARPRHPDRAGDAGSPGRFDHNDLHRNGDEDDIEPAIDVAGIHAPTRRFAYLSTRSCDRCDLTPDLSSILAQTSGICSGGLSCRNTSKTLECAMFGKSRLTSGSRTSMRSSRRMNCLTAVGHGKPLASGATQMAAYLSVCHLLAPSALSDATSRLVAPLGPRGFRKESLTLSRHNHSSWKVTRFAMSISLLFELP